MEYNFENCGYYTGGECNICGMGISGEDTFCRFCKDNPKCYYKQLQELKAENDKLKEEVRTEKIYSSQVEELEESLNHLKQENEKLKHSNENLKLALKTYEMPEVVKVLTDWRTGELDLRINKYKQTLQEIKEIAEQSNVDCIYRISVIRKIITKVEEE